jgi:hypothetical protein
MNGKSIYFTGLWSLLLLTALCLPANGKVIYVDDDATGANNGSNWQNAYKYLQDALTNAKNAQKPVEIRVAQGIYKPDRGTGFTHGNRDATFQLISDVNIVGGYAGLNQPDPNVSDFELYSTILSGDLNGNDVDVNNINDLLTEPTRAENSYNVVTGSNTNNKAILDGFIITAGNANNNTMSNRRTGAGIYLSYGNPMLKNCIFIKNSAVEHGGGMYNYYSNPTLDDSSFIKNLGNYAGGGIFCYSSNAKLTNCVFSGNSGNSSGGMHNNYYSYPVIKKCTFTGNSASTYGGGMGNSINSCPTINFSIFTGNSAYNGGGVYNTDSNTIFSNCIFSKNMAENVGGCIYNSNSGSMGGGSGSNPESNPVITNCTFTGNLANIYGGVIYNSGTLSKPTLINCILWCNSPTQIYGSGINITYCGIQGGWTGKGNMDVDPLFADPDKGDYHLKSKAGRWEPNSQSWVIDDIQSPCIDTGDPNSPVGYEPNSLRINMGSYGGTLEASMSLASDINYFQKSYSPNPANDAVDVLLEPTLSWLSDANAITHEVYFGTSELPPFVKKSYQTNFKPGILEPNTQYYWRIDDVNSLLNRVIGNIWTFTTRDSTQAYHPYPADGAVNISTNITLSWNAGLNAITHNVYLGMDFNNVNIATVANHPGVLVSLGQNSNSYQPGILIYNKQYYWRVDEIDSNGIITAGNIWAFTTQQGAAKGAMCFIGSTPVWIGDKTIAISTAIVGQNTSGNDTVEQAQEHEGTFTVYDVLLDSGNCITVAENHYFMTETGDWSSLHDLKAWMRLKTSEGSVGITNISRQPNPYTGRVYNLKIQGSDRYMVGEDAVIVRDY